MADTFTCIYCLTTQAAESFNREHVIPASFGTFEPDNLLLDQTVCRKCNSFFGRRLEAFLGRDSIEGIQRYRYGVSQPPSGGETFRRRRLILALHDDSPESGTLLELRGVGSDGSLHVDLVAQVVFQRKGGGERRHFAVDDVPPRQELEREGFDVGRVAILTPSPEARAEVVSRLTALGYSMKKWEEGPAFTKYASDDKVFIEGTAKIDEVIRRAATKIAFNYLAWGQGSLFTLSPDFNPVRDYVLKGERPAWPMVTVDKQPILENDAHPRQPVPRHLITMNWDRGRRGIVAELSLFNIFAYRIRLCHNFTGIYREVRSGHAFDVGARTISKLIGLDKSITVVRRF